MRPLPPPLNGTINNKLRQKKSSTDKYSSVASSGVSFGSPGIELHRPEPCRDAASNMSAKSAAGSIMSPRRARPDVAALDSQKATLLDGAPLCAAVLDTNGKAVVVNKVFVELMGPLFKFSDHEFSEAASKNEGKASLKAAIKAVCSGASTRERLSNIEMLTHARWPCMPVKSHFDWFIGSSEGPGDASLCWRGHAVLYGYPCSPEVEQRQNVRSLGT